VDFRQDLLEGQKVGRLLEQPQPPIRPDSGHGKHNRQQSNEPREACQQVNGTPLYCQY
jgi:hypothetical protein